MKYLKDKSASFARITVMLFGVFSAFNLSIVLVHATNVDHIAHVLLGVLAAFCIADFMSGLIHWLADHYGDRNMAILGRLFIGPFRDHHDDPEALLRQDWIELLEGSAFLGLPVSMALFVSHVSGSGLVPGVFVTTLTLVPIFGAFAVAAHRWAHSTSVPFAVKLLHTSGVLIKPKSHTVHHRGDHTSHFCILSGWCNPLLNGFISCVEAFYGRAPDQPILGGPEKR